MKIKINHIILTDENFNEVVLIHKKPILVALYADWSGSCHIMAPIIEMVIKTHIGKITLGMLNLDENPKIAQQYNCTNLPSILFFNERQILANIVCAKGSIHSFLSRKGGRATERILMR